MSRYASQPDRGRPYHKNRHNGTQNNYSRTNYFPVNTYAQEYTTTGDNSYEYCPETQDVYPINPDYNTEYSIDGNTGYNDAEYNTDNNAEYTTYFSAENTEGYENAATDDDYGYYEQHSTECYGYEHSPYGDQTDTYTEPVSHYYNYTSGGMNKGAGPGYRKPNFNQSQNQFGNRKQSFQSQNKFGNRKPNYQSQKHFGSAGPTGRGRGRGQFNQNTGKKTPQQHKPPQRLGQFDMISNSEKGQFAVEGTGQFSLPFKGTGSTTSITKSPAKNVDDNEKKGQFGLPKETVKPQTKTEVLVPSSNAAELLEEKLESDEGKNEQSDEGKNEQSIQKDESKEKSDEKAGDLKGDGDEEDSDSSDEDTAFCKYCKLNFSTPKAYHTHTRGLQHTTLVMEAKAKKGDVRYKKEEVDASVLEVHIPEPKAPSPERVEEDEMEENWMNLDDDVISYIKQNKKPENRDLNPNEVGRNPLPDDFSCPLCNVKCTGAAAFKMHIDGRQHKNNIEAAKQGAKIKKKKLASAGVMVETKERPSKFSEMTKGQPAPMLGLEFVTEFQKTDFKAAARYVCNLCESKCDGSTIVPHVVGLKHRLKYMQVKKPLMYEHLTKFNSRKKKSEMNANLEDFAHQIEAEFGRDDVKIKVELENFDDEDELKETMMRHSKALALKVKELEEGSINSFDDNVLPSKTNSREPPSKKARITTEPESRSRSHYNDSRSDSYKHPEPDDPRRPYNNPRRREYDDPREPYYRRHPEDFRASYRDKLDPYQRDDPYYERRMVVERRHLDGLMAERHRLNDPYAETWRVDDIMERRRCLDELEKSRIADILERRKRIQETDVDYLRLQRFMGRETTAASSSPSLSSEEKTRLDDQLARREALLAGSGRSGQETDVKAIQNKLASHKSNDPNMASEQEKAAKALQEEAAKNPNINIGEIMTNLSSSMIATEDDAAMALQISNALTQALLKYRLQNAPKELSYLAKSIEPMLEQKPAEPSIPGLGGSNTTPSSVPSFLRTSQQSAQSSVLPTASSNTPHEQISSQSTLGLNVQQSSSNPSYLYSQQQSAQSFLNNQYSFTGSTYTQATGSTSYLAHSQQQPTAAATTWAPVTTVRGGVSPGITTATVSAGVPRTHPGEVSAPASRTTAGQSEKKPVIDTSNIDQPQKLLLESIRKQTELLKQRIQASVGIDSQSNNLSVNAESRPKHVPNSTLAATSTNTYTGYASSTKNQVSSGAGHVTYSASNTTGSEYSSQYYQYNYHTAPPNAAPQLAPFQPPLPSEPLAPPLPTNDLPPIRRKRHR